MQLRITTRHFRTPLLLAAMLTTAACSDARMDGSSGLATGSSGSPAASGATASTVTAVVSPASTSANATASSAGGPGVASTSGADLSAPTPGPAPATGSTETDAEGAPANQPVAISGAYLVDCGPAGAPGFGCVLLDPSTKAKAALGFLKLPLLTLGFSDKSTATVAGTLAEPTSPWHFYFQPAASKAELLASVNMDVSANTGNGSFTAASVAYVPPAATPTPAPTPATFAAQDSIVFVTRNAYVPGPTATATALNFNGAAAADALCGEIATAGASLVPTNRKWAAYLATEGFNGVGAVSAPLRLPPYSGNGNFVNAAGGLIISVSNYNSFRGFQSAINLDASATVVSNAQVWTGSDTGNRPVTGGTCSNWTSGLGSGVYGLLTTSAQWTDAGNAPCSQPQHLYCVGISQ